MTRMIFLATVAAVAVGCSNPNRTSDNRDNTTGVQAQSSARSNEAAQPTSDSQAAPVGSDVPDQIVTLTGCLTGGEVPVGTAGAPSRPPVASKRSAAEELATRESSSSAGRFMLIRGKAVEGAAGVGANGAGASGGPLVSGISDYRLEGDAAELSQLVDHQVKLTARINPRPSTAEAPRTDATNGATSTGQSASVGTAGSGIGATSDSRANTGVPPAGRLTTSTGTAPRTLVVESVQMVSATCAQQ